MNTGKLVFAQVMSHLPLTTFRRCVARYDGEHKVKHFTCLDQFLCMAFAQLTYRESLRDIEACLRSQSAKLYHMGFRSTMSRNTLANANAIRDWRIYADFAQSLIGIARPLYVDEPFGVDLSETVYALEATGHPERLQARGLDEMRAWKSANNGRGPWWNAGASHMNEAYPRRFFDALGLVSLLNTRQRFQHV